MTSQAAAGRYLWPPCVADADIIFSSCFFFFFLLSSFFFSSPNLRHRRLDVYHASRHGVALVRIWNAGLKRAARGSLEMQEAKNRQKFAIYAPSHIFVGPISSIYHHNMVNLGPLTAEICWRVWGTPPNFNGFRVLVALLHGTLAVGVSQTLRR